MFITACHSLPTCVGDGALLPVGVSGGEGRGNRPRGDSWFTDGSGERLQLLSSSHDEFSSEAFGNRFSEGVGRGGFWTREREKKGLADENMNASFKKSICFFPHDRKATASASFARARVRAPVLLECIPPMTAKLLSPIFTGVVPVDTSPPSKHTRLCQ